jgi:hypothetical protein
MQPVNAEKRTFRHRTDLLAVQLGVNVNDLPKHLGISRRTLFAGRAKDSAVSRKTWLKLEEAEFDRTRISGSDLAYLRRGAGITKENAAKTLGISIEEYETLEHSGTLMLGSVKRLELFGTKVGGGKRSLSRAEDVRLQAEKTAGTRIESGVQTDELIREAIELLGDYLKEPGRIAYLAEAQGIIQQVLLQRLGTSISDEQKALEHLAKAKTIGDKLEERLARELREQSHEPSQAKPVKTVGAKTA